MFVYIITHLRKNRYYIGITNNTSRRIIQHKNSDSYLGRSIQKYGEHEFDMKIIAEFETIPEAQKMEVELIKLYTEMGLELYNQSLGGEYRGYGNRNMIPVPEALLNGTIRPIEIMLYLKYYNQGKLDGENIIYSIEAERKADSSNVYYRKIKNLTDNGVMVKHGANHVVMSMESASEKINSKIILDKIDEFPNRLLRFSIMAIIMKNKLYNESTVVNRLGYTFEVNKLRYMRERLKEACDIFGLELQITKKFGKDENQYRVVEKRA